MAKSDKPIQSYIYDVASKIVYWETSGHFVSEGTHESSEQLTLFLQGKPWPFLVGEIHGRVRIVPMGTIDQLGPVLERFVAWQKRVPCLGMFRRQGYCDEHCLLPDGHEGDHKRGALTWAPVVPPSRRLDAVQ